VSTLEETLSSPLRVAPATPLRFVAMGGGTGVPRVLAGLGAGDGEPEEGREVDVTAIVTTADDGGSSGELRRRYGVPAPGDVRNCLVALAREAPLADLFQHRFHGDGPFAGHTVGNVVLTALAQRLGDFSAAVEAAAALLAVRGRVVPASGRPVELVAELEDGRVVRGESAIAAAAGRVARVRLSGADAARPEALEAIRRADVVVLGPGSLYSSVIATLLVPGIAEALHATAATRVLVLNLFTQPGETDGYDGAAHLEAIRRHAGDVVDVVLANRPPPGEAVLRAYAAEGAAPVAVDGDALEASGAVPLVTDLLAAGAKARHDPHKLARALLAIARVR
jgi:uncharacterized cofD-like protein